MAEAMAGSAESGVVTTGKDASILDATSDDDAILQASREGLQTCIDDEQDQRKLMLDDLRFSALDQWDPAIRAMRENDVVNGPRPCLTIDQINQYITQVANEMRVNKPSIKARPVDSNADVETAKIFQGLIRHIEDQSNAQVAYGTAGESAVTIGLGFFRIRSDYLSTDSFDQELVIERIPDTLSVYLSRHIMPDGSDANEGWIFEKMPIKEFERKYPKATVADADFSGLGLVPTWKTQDDIIVCEYYYKRFEKATLLYLADGSVMWEDEYQIDVDAPATGKRESERVTIKWCKHTGAEILEKRDLKGKYIPIVEVVGKEKLVEGKRLLWGLVRPAKDSLRAFNYWISAMTEKMALAPKAPFIGAVGQFETHGDKWDKANVNNYAKLEYDPIDVNGMAISPPQRQAPMQMEPAMAQMLAMMQNNVKSSLGMYKAAIGESDPQQSGRAILALKRESDTGTMHFGENLAMSVAQAGRILVDLIPHYYDTKRIIRILGEDGKEQTAMIDPEQKEPMREIREANGNIKRIYNLGVGKYDVTVTTGPGYATSRQEAATVMTELANSAKDPVSAAVLRYAAVKNSDFHGSEEVMKMLKATLPPALQQEDEENPMPPAAMAKVAQLTQALQQTQAQMQQIAAENQQLKSGAQEAQAKIQVSHQEKMQGLQLQAQEQEAELALARQRAEAEIQLKAWVAEQEIAIKKMALSNEIRNDNVEMRHDMQMDRVDAQLKAEQMERQTMLQARQQEMQMEMQHEQQENAESDKNESEA